MNEQEAKEHVKELKEFYSHLANWGGVSLFLCTINLITSPGHLWFLYPMLGWGVGVLAHAVKVYSGNSKWEQRKIEELTSARQTRDELNALSERTDSLIKILSSVDWEKIDPELVHTKQNLEKAKATINKIERGEGVTESEAEKAKVAKEIEKLEEFVTSSKFDYYELAATESKK